LKERSRRGEEPFECPVCGSDSYNEYFENYANGESCQRPQYYGCVHCMFVFDDLDNLEANKEDKKPTKEVEP
jgi:hypothetical protein